MAYLTMFLLPLRLSQAFHGNPTGFGSLGVRRFEGFQPTFNIVCSYSSLKCKSYESEFSEINSDK
jgi:hypothetical protein